LPIKVLEQLGLFGDASSTDPPLPGAWKIRRSKRARRITIHVLPTGAIEVVAPMRASGRAVRRFVEENHDWIRRHAPRAYSPVPVENPVTISLPALDLEWEISYRESPRRSVRMAGSALIASAPDTSPDLIWPVLRNWLKSVARQHVPQIVSQHARRMNVEPAAIQVRIQKTRWGSCSSRGTISVNAAGLLLSPQEFDYLIAHELCHLRHLNHSRKFWQLLEQYQPDYEALDARLNTAWRELPHWVYT
jgi:predicted metal-dependent hydrolase